MILGFQGTTLINYPKQVASIIFLADCNLHCPYCYNKSLVYPNRSMQPLTKDYILKELKDRENFNTGVCISGGEPTLYHLELIELLDDIKRTVPNINIKLDTNGTRPEVLEPLLKSKKIDYIAMDYKTIPSEYKGVFSKCDISDAITESMRIIRENLDPEHYEFRTTVTRDFFNEEVAKGMAKFLQKQDHIYIQNFKYFGEEFHINIRAFNDVDIIPFRKDEITKIIEPITKKCDNVFFRNF